MNKRITKEFSSYVATRKSKVVSDIVQKAQPAKSKKGRKGPSKEERKLIEDEEEVLPTKEVKRENIFEKIFAEDSYEHIEVRVGTLESMHKNGDPIASAPIPNQNPIKAGDSDSDDSFGEFIEKSKSTLALPPRPKNLTNNTFTGLSALNAHLTKQGDHNIQGNDLIKSQSKAPTKRLKRNRESSKRKILVEDTDAEEGAVARSEEEEKSETKTKGKEDQIDAEQEKEDILEGVDSDLQEETQEKDDVGYRNPVCIPAFLSKETRRDKQGNLASSPDYDPTTLLMTEDDKATIKPFLREYWRVKCAHFDKIVLVKLGRFYEAFFDDAEVCKLILNPKYTRKYKIGFPEELFNPYLSRLTENNLKVVIIEQMETVKQQQARIQEMKSRGEKLTDENKLIRREVSAIYSKGTAALQFVRSRKLQLTPNHYILSIVTEKLEKDFLFGLCFFDSITGKMLLTTFQDDSILSTFTKLIYIFRPLEILYLRRALHLDCLRLLSSLPTKPVTTEINDPSAWNKDSCIREIERIFGDKEKWPRVLVHFSDLNCKRSEADPAASAGMVLSALGGLIHYMKASLLFDETIPIANYVYLDHENNLEVTDFDVKFTCKTEENPDNQLLTESETPSRTSRFGQNSRLVLDAQTLSCLDILELSYGSESQNQAIKAYSLYNILNQTNTPFGSRLMKLWVSSPLLNKCDIEERLDSIEDLNNHKELSDSFRKELAKLSDLENILLRLYSYRVKNKGRGVYFEDVSVLRLSELRKFIKELGSILQSLSETLFAVCAGFKSERLKMLVGYVQDSWVKCESGIHKSCLDTLNKIDSKVLWVGVSNSLPTPMMGLSPAYEQTIEAIESLDLKARQCLTEFQKELNNDQRIKYNHFRAPFAIEVPKQHLAKVNQRNDLDLVASTVAANRYTTAQTREIAEQHACLHDKLKQYLADFTCVLFDEFFSNRNNWNQAINVIAELDCLLALSSVSFSSELKKKAGRMVRPQFTQPIHADDPSFLVGINCFHPAVCLSARQEFIPNNIILNSNSNGEFYKKLQLITGPNMGGKSTYLRTASLLVIMGQIGCYVPCDYLEFSVFDRLFTRIGLSDTLALNKSTFYLELEETLHIVRNATKRSLILIDELGRGTSTFDGVSLASGVISYIIKENKSCCLFSTHSNLLVDEYRLHPSVQCFQMSYEKHNDSDRNRITFSFKLLKGEAQSSFALNVLNIVGFDQSIIFKSSFMASMLSLIAKP